MSLREALRDRRVFLAVAGWTLLNVVMAWGAASLTDGAYIAWEAHLGGFYMGLLSFGLFDRSPEVIAATVLRDAGTRRDDAGVLVARS